MSLRTTLTVGGLAVALLMCVTLLRGEKDEPVKGRNDLQIAGYDYQVPRDDWKMPFKEERPVYFINRSQAPAEWDKLPTYWNEFDEKATDPRTGREVIRKAVKVKVPLGLTRNPPVPAENPITVQKWALGKKLYFDDILSSDKTVSCATCHDPKRGYTDRSSVSKGIRGLMGGMSAPTVFNSAYSSLQFWDGRALSLEDQAQGPVQNSVEMFDGDGHAWNKLVARVRARPEYVREFKAVFGTEPTRDAIAKAIATYERTVLSGNSIHDRAEKAMRDRVEEEETGKFEFKDKDYEKVLKAAFASKDAAALEALGLDAAKDAGKVADVAKSLNNGRVVFFNKGRCNLCHVGDNFSDNLFHNLGVGAKDGKLPPELQGRYGSLPTGHKNPEAMGAFKTPTLRHVVGTAPYLHDGSELTLEKVVDLYDRGGNANAFLDTKMRDYDAEKAYAIAREDGKEYKGAEIVLCGPDKKAIAPLKLKLTEQEKKDLVLFMRALQGDPVDPLVGDKDKMPK